MTTLEGRLSAGGAIGRALAAAVVTGLGIALTSHVAAVLGTSAAPSEPLASRLLVAATMTVVVVAAVLVLRRWWDRASLRGLGLTGFGASARGFLLGLVVVAVPGAGTLAVLAATGAAEVRAVDVGALAAFLLTNALVALLLEAIPEELALRGYALTALRSRFGRGPATVLCVAAFLLVPVVAFGAQGLAGLVTGGGDGFAVAPPGEDPVVYAATLAALGALLVGAREATVSATVWTCVGAHLAFLTVNQFVLGAGDTGVVLDLGDGALLLFFAVYVSAAVIGVDRLRARADRRGGGLGAAG